MVALSVAERADLLAEMTSSLRHTYSRTVRVVGALDDWNVQTYTDGTPATAQACWYGVSSRGRRDEIGKLVSQEPTLLVAASDPLAPGDLVSDIRDAAGALLLAGPSVVASVEARSNAGIPIARLARLESTQAIPTTETG